MNLRIDKDVPLPPPSGGRGKSNYPFADMEVGDSFLVEGVSQRSISATATSFGKRHNMTFATRKVDDGIRVWRTS